MNVRILAATAALASLSSGFAAAPAAAQIVGQSCSQSWYGNCLNSADFSDRRTTSHSSTKKTTVYAPPSVHTGGNSTADCIARWDFSVSAWLAGIGIGIPEKDRECAARMQKQLELAMSAEERAKIALGMQVCVSVPLALRYKDPVCVSTRARLLVLLSNPMTPPRAEEPTKTVAARPARQRAQLAERDEAFTR